MARILIAIVVCVVTVLTAAPAAGEAIYAQDLRSGPLSEWVLDRGTWTWGPHGLSNASHGENRIFLDLARDIPEYEINLAACLSQGQGWGLLFGAYLDDHDRLSGYGFQYEPQFHGGAYLLQEWMANGKNMLERVEAALDSDVFHDFTFHVTPDAFLAFQDGDLVLSYEGELPAAGSLVGLRTWSNSEATFRDVSIQAIPEPPAFLLLLAGAVAGFRRLR
jgi:hypothetical protein